MVRLTATPRIIDALCSLPRPKDLSRPQENITLPSQPGDPIPHTTLISLSKQCRTPLNILLRGTKPYHPPPPQKPEPTPEYTALMTHLRTQEEQKTYRALFAQQSRDEKRAFLGQTTLADDDNKDETSNGSDDISPSLVLNILLSIVMCAVATFQITKWWAGGNDGVRVLMSLATGIAVGIAEVGVYAGYLRKVGEAKVKERRKRERKVVVAEYRGDGKGVDAMGRDVDVDVDIASSGKRDAVLGDKVEAERIEIWGKGVNGGMRRRIKDKWEKERNK